MSTISPTETQALADSEDEAFACRAPSKCLQYPTPLSTSDRLNEGINSTALEHISKDKRNFNIPKNCTAYRAAGHRVIRLSKIRARHSGCTPDTTPPIVQTITSGEAIASTPGGSVITKITELTNSVSFPGLLLDPQQVSTTTAQFESGAAIQTITRTHLVDPTPRSLEIHAGNNNIGNNNSGSDAGNNAGNVIITLGNTKNPIDPSSSVDIDASHNNIGNNNSGSDAGNNSGNVIVTLGNTQNSTDPSPSVDIDASYNNIGNNNSGSDAGNHSGNVIIMSGNSTHPENPIDPSPPIDIQAGNNNIGNNNSGSDAGNNAGNVIVTPDSPASTHAQNPNTTTHAENPNDTHAESSNPAKAIAPAKIIVPAVIVALLGILLLIGLGYYIVVRRRVKRIFSKAGKNVEAELGPGDAWDARPPAQTDTIHDLHIGPTADSTYWTPPDLTASTSLEPQPSHSTTANSQTDDNQDERTHATTNSRNQVRALPGAASSVDSGRANVMISEGLREEFTSVLRAEIQRAVAESRSERRPSIQWQQEGGNLNADRVRSSSIHETAPPEYQE